MTTATRQTDTVTASPLAGLARGALRFAALFLNALDVARQRRRLLALDERMLKDIGLSRSDAEREAHRGFWDIPQANGRF